MSKHEVITHNLTALTGLRSFDKAAKGWDVERIFLLRGRKMQACELCGTRFREGALVHHRNSNATIVVGGTCLITLQRRRFPPRFNFRLARRVTFDTLRRLYGPIVHPGNWIKWTVENAPKGLAQSVADLRCFGAVLESSELDTLIRFHDRKRLFNSDALLSDVLLVESVLREKIPFQITINQARFLRRNFDAKVKSEPERLSLWIRSEDYKNNVVGPFIKAHRKLASTWKSLSSLEQRAVTALVALDGRATKEGTPLCPDEVAANWPVPQRGNTGPMFVWNTKVGFGFVRPQDLMDDEKARVWLWRSGEHTSIIYNLRYWRALVGCSLEAVKRVEQLAFLRTDVLG